MKKANVNWNSPEHFSKTKDGTTQERDLFSVGEDLADVYVVHNDRFGRESAFCDKVFEETTLNKVEIVWDYDLVCGSGEEHIAIHISDKDDEAELLDGLIEKTQQALDVMQSRKAFLKQSGRKPSLKKAS